MRTVYERHTKHDRLTACNIWSIQELHDRHADACKCWPGSQQGLCSSCDAGEQGQASQHTRTNRMAIEDDKMPNSMHARIQA